MYKDLRCLLNGRTAAVCAEWAGLDHIITLYTRSHRSHALHATGRPVAAVWPVGQPLVTHVWRHHLLLHMTTVLPFKNDLIDPLEEVIKHLRLEYLLCIWKCDGQLLTSAAIDIKCGGTKNGWKVSWRRGDGVDIWGQCEGWGRVWVDGSWRYKWPTWRATNEKRCCAGASLWITNACKRPPHQYLLSRCWYLVIYC